MSIVDRAQWPLLLGVAAMTGVGYYLLHRYSNERERRRCEDAYRKLDVAAMTPRQIWDAALELHRAERTQLHADNLRLENLCHEGETVLAAAEAWKRIRKLREDGAPGFACAELLAREAEAVSASPPFADVSQGLYGGAQQLREMLARGEWAALGIDPPDPDSPTDRHWQWVLAMSGGSRRDREARCCVGRVRPPDPAPPPPPLPPSTSDASLSAEPVAEDLDDAKLTQRQEQLLLRLYDAMRSTDNRDAGLALSRGDHRVANHLTGRGLAHRKMGRVYITTAGIKVARALLRRDAHRSRKHEAT